MLKLVGRMSALIREFRNNCESSYEKRECWYLYKMRVIVKRVTEKIRKTLCQEVFQDFVLVKT